MQPLRLTSILTLLGLLLAAVPARAQADYTESFDNLGTYTNGQLGPPVLIQRGWIFRNQSEPGPPSWTWREGPYHLAGCGYDTFAPQAGAGYLGSDGKSASWQGGRPSNWAILPVIPGQQAGDEISFFAQQVQPRAETVLEVRYSPSGGTSTGSSVTDVGDFTDALLTIHPPVEDVWTFYSVPIPGTGRLALRYTTTISQNPCVQVIGFDTLRVGPRAGPCDGYPVVPGPGQTVTWTLADSPHRICAYTDVPETATVVVEAGAEVLVDPGAVLEVHGELVVHHGAHFDTPYLASVLVHGRASFLGTAADPVLLSGGPRSNFLFAPERVGAMDGGLILARNVDLATTFSALNSGVVVADGLRVSGAGNGFYGNGADLYYGGTFAVRDSVFESDTEIWTAGSYLLLDHCTFDGSTFRPGRPHAGQTLFLDDLVAQNRSAGSVFNLYGGDFFFGPRNQIQGNAYPVVLENGGIAPGSWLPRQGNSFNVVNAGHAGAEGRVHWGDAGIPYRVLGGTPAPVGGHITVEPGVRIQLSAGASIRPYYGATFEMEGLPEAPIVLERFSPAQPWTSFDYGAAVNRVKVEHTHFRGGSFALTAELAILHVESCIFEDNGVAFDAYSEGHIFARGNRVLDNGVGARSNVDSAPSGYEGSLDLDGGPNPNWIEGNGTGLLSFITLGPDYARENYWGDPSGPEHPDNPGGQGDSAQGYNFVMPFRAEAPSADQPPIVRLEPHSRLLEEGAKHILHWSARDDVGIRSFRILYAPHGEDPELRVIADRIPGSARSWEVVIPEAPPDNNYPQESSFRVEATDSLGQTGWDHIFFRTPWLHNFSGGFQIEDLVGVHRPGERFQMCGNYYGSAHPGNALDAFLWLEADGQERSYGVGPYDHCGFTWELPPFSTDLARLVTVLTAGAGGSMVFDFSDYFEIRPDPLIGDAPPQIALLSPRAGEQYDGGGFVSVEWTASDDEALRSFDLQASYDGGRTWSTVVHELEPASRRFGWRLPPSTGIPAVSVRVIARDLRFQNSSSTSGAFSIRPGPHTGGYRQTR